ncbi:TonB-dependent receptor [Colwellia sp. UCD-KL20]|uniref:TonB-dependent receptor n=1 Tax=Colwellia sp. UCD-KL20 TaxID=1917165 RepID=UPI0025703320|nr:TonB-dependent receptor [Colwellia sp. UCD-KL20]
MSIKHKVHPLSMAIAISIASVPISHAFAEESKQASAEEIEVIEVKGFKGSLLRSLNNKRLNDSVSDSIFSEDIGKSADQDIGEALQRVTGVSIQRGGGFGEGDATTVTVRGAGPNLNNITLNGIALTSNTENQAVDLSGYSSDILNSIEILKTSSADHDEGSLGAGVLLKTFRPLDASEDKRVLEIQGRYDDFAEENDHKFSGSFSQKLMDDTLGLYVTAFSEKQASRKDMFYTDTLNITSVDNAIDAQTGELTGPVTGYSNGQNGYKLFKNSLKRDGFTAALQWAISDNTEVNFNVTMTDQFIVTNDNSIAVIGAENANLASDPVLDPNNPWIVYDTDKQFFTKKIDRSARGRIKQLQSGVETKNKIYSLDLTHFWSDTLRMDLKIGATKTVANDEYYTLLNTNNYVHVSGFDTIPNSVIEPTGYDCTSGKCVIVTGEGLVDFGPGQTGAPGEDTSDNIATTGFNPDDLAATHLQQAYSRDRDMSDKQKSAYLDFDWDVELGPITQFEFGAKYQKRNKDVFNQSYQFEGVPVPFGQEALGTQIDSVQLSQVTDGLTPHGDNFMSELGYGRDNTTDGWYTINGAKAFDLLFANDDVRAEPDLGNDRQIELENQAIYFKANFSLLDDDLTGNIGFRYVKSNVESAGYSSIRYQNGAVSSRELIKIANDSSLPACTDEQLYANGESYDEDINGIGGPNFAGGFDTNGNFGPIASQNCYDVNFDLNPDTRNRYADGTSERKNPDQFAATGSSESTNFLPSLTLSYKINEDMVGRFALSKTMARPRIDSLKPSYSMAQNVWGAGDSNGTINNPALKPLESKNIDLSYEWYFNEGGAFSLAYFHKDMSNFEEKASINAHWVDLTSMDQSVIQSSNPLDFLIEKGADGKDLLFDETPNCFENSRHRWQTNSLESSSVCDTIIVNLIRNGKGGTNQGIEVGYTQNFDFLPGVFGGLGTTMNYTYSDSKTDAEIGALNTKLSSLPMENVSKHQLNISGFWEADGNLIRLAYNHRTDSLAQRSHLTGALWNEGGGQLDLSANYKINDNFTVTFNAVNIGKRIYRQYYTNLTDVKVKIDGNALEGGVDKSKTIREWSTGTIYRLGVRATF